jgi:type IV secretion system protein VirB11
VTALARVYLDTFIAPLSPYLAREDVTDLYINRPGEVWVETGSGSERHDDPAIDDALLWRLARQIAAAADQGINREHPLLAATLPDGARVQICAPPATRGHVVVAIRKHSVPDLRLADYAASGAFACMGERSQLAKAADEKLRAMLTTGDVLNFLAEGVRARKTIVVAGGTGTGKTTFLNALLREANPDERLLLIEDTPEVQLHHANAVGLVAVRGHLGEASVTASQLIEAALRLRPDRIIMGEIRGSEALSWLRAAGTGHPGSITTVHANSPSGAAEQLALMCMMGGVELRRAELIEYIDNVVDIFVQLGRDGGKRAVVELRFT